MCVCMWLCDMLDTSSTRWNGGHVHCLATRTKDVVEAEDTGSPSSPLSPLPPLSIVEKRNTTNKKTGVPKMDKKKGFGRSPFFKAFTPPSGPGESCASSAAPGGASSAAVSTTFFSPSPPSSSDFNVAFSTISRNTHHPEVCASLRCFGMSFAQSLVEKRTRPVVCENSAGGGRA